MQQLKKSLKKIPSRFAAYWKRSWLHKVIVVFAALALLCLGTAYGIAQWYIHSEAGKPLVLGASFIPAYAESLGLNAQDTLDALITQAGVRHFRLVSYWDQLEPSPGKYDFSLLDWQFQKIEAAHGTVALSLGLRQPRWPECHLPSWAAGEPASQWQPQLQNFISAVVSRYKNSPALQSYQLENEYFLQGFGLCTNFDRARLVSEYNNVKKLDPHHSVIIARSNNALGFPAGQPTPDEFGISIYKRVWDAAHFHRYVEYPFPAWFYGFLAGTQKILTGKDMIIHELQAEAWPPDGKSITETSLAEQNKSFNAQRFADRIQFGKATGMREMYLWGAEYWYYRLTVLHDTSVWNVAKQAFAQSK
ncbi:MAG TPA: beta-galactosidase [Candidatus Saccharimonadales bacterium]